MISVSKWFSAAKFPAVLAALASCLLSACTSTPQIVSPGIPTELKHSWEVLFNQANAEGVAALYTPDAQLMMSGVAPIRGMANIKRALQDMISSGLKVKIDTEQNIASGEVAYVSGTYRVLQGEGGAELEHGSYAEVWRLRKGVWRISLDVNASGAP